MSINKKFRNMPEDFYEDKKFDEKRYERQISSVNGNVIKLNSANCGKKDEKRGKKNFLKKLIGCIIIGVAAVIILMLSPVFTLDEIEITPLECYSDEQILDMTGIHKGMNIFAINVSQTKKTLESDNFIESATINYKLPNKVVLTIEERRVRGYVEYMGSYLYIDEYGRVLKVDTKMDKPLPLVQGLKFSGSFTLGETLVVDNNDALEVLVKLSVIMSRYEILDKIITVDVSKPNDIKLNTEGIEVQLGGLADMDEKIRIFVKILESDKISEKDRGVLDISDVSKPIIFKYLT